MSPRVLIAGISTRAAAESAARAGFDVVALDGFADIDQHPSVRALSLPRDFAVPFSPGAVGRVARGIPCDAVAYLSNFENDPDSLEVLAAGRALWGNPPGVLRRVRDPFELADTFRRSGVKAPLVVGKAPDDPNEQWLVKPFASGGGHGVRWWKPHASVPRGHYLQQFVDGRPASVVFVAAGGRGVPLGISRQLVGECAFGVSGFRYCGSILTFPPQRGEVVEMASRLVDVVAREFGMVGVGSVDFIEASGGLHPVEVNPRWSASMELVERACSVSVFGAHAEACARGALPASDLSLAHGTGGAHGKAVVFARRDVVAGDTRTWLGDSRIRDVPAPGERIAAGHPVCTVLADGPDEAACHAALVRRAEGVYAELGT